MICRIFFLMSISVSYAKIGQEKSVFNVVQTAVNAGSFKTLTAALSTAGLIDNLSSPNGPFTVFAPSDDAFSKLPTGLVECLVKPENKDALTSILLYHVVAGKVLSSDLSDGQVVGTLNGDDVTIDLSSGVKINASTVTNADILASNGVIHIIDSVLVPPSVDVEVFLSSCGPDKDIMQTAVDAGSFTTLTAAVSAADLTQALSSPNGPFTVFAPSDDAFSKLPAGLVECLVKPENKDALTSILLYHAVAGKVLSSDLSDGQVVETLNGEDSKIDLSSGVKINTSTVTNADILASNGVIHVIDSVLVPPSVDVEVFLSSCGPDKDIIQMPADFSCDPGSDGCCSTMVPPSFLPPDDSTCWQWWVPPVDGVMTPNMDAPTKGCNYKPCEATVCACDSYCCESAWDLSCRGYRLNAEDTIDNNYFVKGCSAKMLCCEPDSAYPESPVGGALPEPNDDM